MQIACPGCAAQYEVPSASLLPRRKVRCTRCNAEWVPVQEADTPPAFSPDPIAPAEAGTTMESDVRAVWPEQTAMDRLAAAPPLRRSGALRAAWGLTALLLIGSAAATLTWRTQVTRVWPASAWILGSGGPPAPPSLAADPHPAAKPAKPTE